MPDSVASRTVNHDAKSGPLQRSPEVLTIFAGRPHLRFADGCWHCYVPVRRLPKGAAYRVGCGDTVMSAHQDWRCA